MDASLNPEVPLRKTLATSVFWGDWTWKVVDATCEHDGRSSRGKRGACVNMHSLPLTRSWGSQTGQGYRTAGSICLKNKGHRQIQAWTEVGRHVAATHKPATVSSIIVLILALVVVLKRDSNLNDVQPQPAPPFLHLGLDAGQDATRDPHFSNA